MSNIRDYLDHLNIELVRTEGKELVCVCPLCGGRKLYVNNGTGKWHCFKCGEGGHPYQLAKKLKPEMQSKEIFALLSRFGFSERVNSNQAGDRGQKETSRKGKRRDFASMAKKFQQKMTAEKYEDVSKTLGVSVESLKRLNVGYDGKANTFPMSDGSSKIIGIRRRFPDGQKVSVRGGRNGLFIPDGLTGEGTLMIAEGNTDTAAALDLGYDAIGRPSCNGGTGHIVNFIKDKNYKQIIMIPDNDAKDNGRNPGLEGGKRLAGKLAGMGHDVRLVLPPAGKDLREWVADGLTRKMLGQEIDKAKPAEPEPEQTTQSRPLHTYPQTDVGTAEMLADLCGDQFRYCHDWGTWVVWDGVRWNRKKGNPEVRRALVRAARRLRTEAVTIEDLKFRKAVEDYARSLESSAKISSVLKEAQAIGPFSCYAADFDCDAWLLNLTNGTYNLKTGKLQPHTPNDMITQAANIEYDPEATCSRFDVFMQQITGGNREVADYIIRVLGMCLTGSVQEQLLFVFWGIGANGKSVLLDTFCWLAGEYAGEAAPDLLTVRKFGEHACEIADLQGKRLIIASETDEGAELKIQQVKRLTGNARLKARFMRQDFFEFNRTHKLILVTNNRPIVREHSNAVWRRLRLVPFDVVIPESRQDKALLEKLKTEGPGILNRLLKGCQDWQEFGLCQPEEIDEATWQYQNEQAPLDAFFADCCKFDPLAMTPVSSLRIAYQEWATDRGVNHTLSNRRFNKEMRKAGCTYDTKYLGGEVQKVWSGIDILPREPEDVHGYDTEAELFR